MNVSVLLLSATIFFGCATALMLYLHFFQKEMMGEQGDGGVLVAVSGIMGFSTLGFLVAFIVC